MLGKFSLAVLCFAGLLSGCGYAAGMVGAQLASAALGTGVGLAGQQVMKSTGMYPSATGAPSGYSNTNVSEVPDEIRCKKLDGQLWCRTTTVRTEGATPVHYNDSEEGKGTGEEETLPANEEPSCYRDGSCFKKTSSR